MIEIKFRQNTHFYYSEKKGIRKIKKLIECAFLKLKKHPNLLH